MKIAIQIEPSQFETISNAHDITKLLKTHSVFFISGFTTMSELVNRGKKLLTQFPITSENLIFCNDPTMLTGIDVTLKFDNQTLAKQISELL